MPVRDWTVCLRGFRRGTVVSIGGETLPVTYDEATNTASITLQEVRPDRGVQLDITHEVALLHDNSDCRDRILDRVTRAQNSQRDKAFLMEIADKLLRQVAQGRPIRPWNTGASECPSLGGYIVEMVGQL